jgi:Tol biopolymer transport system component
MPLPSGTRLGTYQILAPIGIGGMGEVYRAHDTALGRDVAIKVLPAGFSSDPDRLARFQRESKVLASLKHPNIAVIHGLHESPDLFAFVMELVEGDTLTCPVPLATALGYAKQIASALEYAHDKGIVHRDLKPANIKVSPDGIVKLLDFGLSKVIEGPSSGGSPEGSHSTITGATHTGVVLGTAAYMSPEQACGEPVDRRTDIWSFGAVLYEALSGRRAFPGTSASDTVASVLKLEPDWKALPPDTPAAIRKLVERCLKKDRRQRLQAMGDARIEIEEVLAGESLDILPSRSRKITAGWIVAGLLAAAVTVLGVTHFRETPTRAAAPVRFAFSLPDGVAFNNPAGTLAVSPDGKYVLYVGVRSDGVRRLYVRELDGLEAHALEGTEGVNGVPFWSVDGRAIAFGDGSKLKKVAVAGGRPQVLCDNSGLVGGGFWTRDGQIVFGTAGQESGLFKVPADGGVRVQLTRLDRSRGEIFHAHPSPLMDGRQFVYTRAAEGDQGGIYVGSVDARPEEQGSNRLLADQTSPVYLAPSEDHPGYLLFLRDGALLAQSFDARTLTLAGDPVTIAEGVARSGRFGAFSTSSTGVLAYRASVGRVSEMKWLDRQGRQVSSPASGRLYVQAALSPDEHRVATVIESDAGNDSSRDIWVLDLARSGVATRLTSAPREDASPTWSPDGTRIAFSSIRNGGPDLYVKASNGTGDEEVLLRSDQGKYVNHWSRDGFLLYTTGYDPITKYDLWVLPVDGDRTAAPFLQTQFNEYQGQFSPDGRWVAYVSDESGRPEVYVQPFSTSSRGGERVTISNSGGTQPRWRPDGKELFYVASSEAIMAVDVTPAAPFKAGVPKLVMDADAFLRFGQQTVAGTPVSGFRWDSAAGGQRFLVITAPQSEPASASINVELNWQARLGTRALRSATP